MQRMQKVVGSNPTEDKIRFSQFTLFYRVECEKLFCKTNMKLKVLKLNKTKFISYMLYSLDNKSVFYQIKIIFYDSDKLITKSGVWHTRKSASLIAASLTWARSRSAEFR